MRTTKPLLSGDDIAWKEEVRFETVRMVTDVEQRGTAANLVAWVVIGLGAAALPNAELFIVPLAIRLAAMLFNKWGWNKLRQSMRANPNTQPDFWLLGLCLLVGGMSWALVIAPMLLDPVVHPARLAVGGTVLVGVGLIVNMLAPVKKLALSFAGGFLLAFGIAMSTGEQPHGAILFLSTTGLFAALLPFAFASTREKIMTAQNLVDNRRLEAALSDALAEAELLATRDPLTGMLNRRAFFDICMKESASTESEQRHLMTIDLDHFKRINDEHGHKTGDDVLVATASQIEEILKSLPGTENLGCRLGGEEFVVLTSGIDTMTLQAIAEAMRRRISQIPGLMNMPDKIEVSASIGIAEINPEETFDEALRRSDLAMYRAKDRGRDRVENAA